MANAKISALTAATTPLDGTEVLPIVQSGATKKVANNDLRPKQIQSNATSGVLQVVGPAAAATRVMTVPNANFTAARTDAAQTFTGTQTFSSDLSVSGLTVGAGGGGSVTNAALGGSALSANVTGSQNAAVGRFALLANKTDDNTAVGFASLYSTVTGNQNSAFGSTALFNATGIQNTAVGANAGLNLTTGSNCGFFGYNVQPSSATVSNEYNYGNSAVSSHRFYGNVTMLSSTAGVNFTANTPAAGMTSQLLNWYEEGTWTPTDASGASLTFTSASGKYTRMGNIIVAIWTVTYPTTANTSAAVIGGLPFTSAASGVTGQTIPGYNTANIAIVGNVDVFTKNIRLQNQNFSTNVTNNQMSGARFDGTTIYTVTA